MSARNKYSRPVEVVSNQLVEKMVACEWLSQTPAGTLRVSNAASTLWERDRSADFEPPYFCHKQFMTSRSRLDEEGNLREITVNGAENPLVWLRYRKDKAGNPFISQEELEAGERFQRDYTLAQLEPATTANWQAFLKNSRRQGARVLQDQTDTSGRALAAKRRFYKAVDTLGQRLSPIAVEVCCLSNGLEAAERRLGYSRRSGKVALRKALRTLAEHYGLLACTPDSNARSKILLVARPGYRPKI